MRWLSAAQEAHGRGGLISLASVAPGVCRTTWPCVWLAVGTARSDTTGTTLTRCNADSTLQTPTPVQTFTSVIYAAATEGKTAFITREVRIPPTTASVAGTASVPRCHQRATTQFRILADRGLATIITTTTTGSHPRVRWAVVHGLHGRLACVVSEAGPAQPAAALLGAAMASRCVVVRHPVLFFAPTDGGTARCAADLASTPEVSIGALTTAASRVQFKDVTPCPRQMLVAVSVDGQVYSVGDRKNELPGHDYHGRHGRIGLRVVEHLKARCLNVRPPPPRRFWLTLLAASPHRESTFTACVTATAVCSRLGTAECASCMAHLCMLAHLAT